MRGWVALLCGLASTAAALTDDERSTIALFERASPAVVYITSLSVRRDFFTLNVPVNPDYGSVIARAPGVFVDPSGNASIGGATGLENVYIVNGQNVTGLRFGNLDAGLASVGARPHKPRSRSWQPRLGWPCSLPAIQRSPHGCFVRLHRFGCCATEVS